MSTKTRKSGASPVPDGVTVEAGQVAEHGAIAIVGMSGRFPRANTLRQYWENLRDGVDCVTEIPFERWDYRNYFDAERGKPGKVFTKWGGFIEGVDEFDPLFFNISPRDAAAVDPRARLLLEVVWTLLEDIGCTRESLQQDYQSRVGVYVGASGADIASIANRISYFLDLEGPSAAIDTMCSSSAMAVHLACQALRQGECELAIVAGANLSVDPERYIALNQLQMTASHPDSRSFGDGDGFLLAEGVGAVLLKPLAKAVEHGDQIQAVIRGTATKHSGRSFDYWVPNPSLQAKVVNECLQRARIDARTISYVEAAATGSALTDAVEVMALRQVFGRAVSAKPFCALGSVQSNIGHPEGAAAMAQLIKVVLQLQHQELVPSIKAEPLNPKLRLERTPFVLQRDLADWHKPTLTIEGKTQEVPRRALINSFGAGGTYVSLVVEEYLAASPKVISSSTNQDGPQLCIFSAKNVDRLQAMAGRMRLWLEQQDAIDLSDLAYTLQVGREAMDARLAFVVRNREELLSGLAAYLAASSENGEAAKALPYYLGYVDGTGSQSNRLSSGGLGSSPVQALVAARDLERLALLWTKGGKVPWRTLHDRDSRRILTLPNYPFVRHRYPKQMRKVDEQAAVSAVKIPALQISPEQGVDTPMKERVRTSITRILSDVLEIPSELIRSSAPMRDYGMGSLLGMKLLRQLEAAFNVRVTGRELLKHATIDALAGLVVKRLNDSVTTDVVPDFTRSRDIGVGKPSLGALSEGQKGLWWLQEAAPQSTGYHIPLCLRLTRPVRAPLLKQAISALLDQQPLLACVVREEGGHFYLTKQPSERVTLVQENFAALTDDAVVPHLRQIVKASFSLKDGPLIRIHLIESGPAEQILLIVVHHILADGKSSQLLLQALFATYDALAAGKSPIIEVPQSSYADFVTWEKALLASKRGQEHLLYWREQLSGPLPVLELPTDHPRYESSHNHGQTYIRPLAADLEARLLAFSDSHSVSAAVVLLSIYQLLLSRYAGQEDIVVGVPTMGRPEERFEKLIGHFVNMIAIRSRLKGDDCFSDLMRTVQVTLVDGLDHAEYPFPALVRELNVPRSERTPIFQVAFMYQDESILRLDAGFPADGPLATAQMIPGVNQEGEYELVLEVCQRSAGHVLNFKYDPELFEGATVARMADHFVGLLERVLEDPQQPLGAYPLLTRAERQTVLIDWNKTEADYAKDQCVHQLLEQQARHTPDAIAVSFAERSLSYGELNRRSNQLAHHLRNLGVAPDVVVGLCIDRSIEMVVAVLGILKAGGAYLPLDPSYPAARLEFMLADSGASVLITESALGGWVGNLFGKVVLLDADKEAIEQRSAASVPRPATAEDLAYTIYTSGSTGKPKGVAVPHRGLTNIVSHFAREVEVVASDTLLAVSPLSFDIASLELFLPLTQGATLRLLTREQTRDGEELVREVRHATLMQATPATWHLLLEAGWEGNPNLRALCGGEALSWKLATKLAQSTNRAWNCYGPTETTIWSSTWLIDIERGAVSIGRGASNTQLYVLDAKLQPVPVGIPGELFIGGDGVTRGYMGRPELTRERFIANPFTKAANGRLYRTGDLVRWSADGNLEFLERVDSQVKVRGFRIELGEIEAMLTTHPAVSRCAVIARTEKEGDSQLVAYYVATGNAAGVEELRQHLRLSLPEHMVPVAFVTLPDLPLSSSGKVDRKALAACAVPQLEEPRLKPRDGLEQALAEIWKEVLGVDAVDASRTFFEHGGNSLKILRVQQRIRAKLEMNVAAVDLFKYPTIESLADYLRQGNQPVERMMVAEVSRKTDEEEMLNRIRQIDGLSSAELERELTENLKQVLAEEAV
ncbi:non-ribosomal peptide synthetase [Bradyrhizobium sp. SZCCHNR1020]|uniref:non-ribosomal peptide synthetase n=1 Tax=Bradyrhizobium sp. SZCCHNR1020 TaxID=3057343 RepID=UPI002916AC8F|nr:non-ribosomal peptide synthetase [Bradyrhizobium sp. SZCCHNR1020]